MSSTEIRSLETTALRRIVNGLTGADHMTRMVAQNEIDRRRRGL